MNANYIVSRLAPRRRQCLRGRGPVAFGELAVVEAFRLGVIPE